MLHILFLIWHICSDTDDLFFQGEGVSRINIFCLYTAILTEVILSILSLITILMTLFTICKSNISDCDVNRYGKWENGNRKLLLWFMSLPMNYIEIMRSEYTWSPKRIYHFSNIHFVIERDPPVDWGHLQLGLKRRFADLREETSGKEKEWNELNVPAAVGSD